MRNGAQDVLQTSSSRPSTQTIIILSAASAENTPAGAGKHDIICLGFTRRLGASLGIGHVEPELACKAKRGKIHLIHFFLGSPKFLSVGE
jgi:hypothetical protein